MYYEEIKSRLTMPEVVTYYHMQPNRAKFVICPFHREKTPSMKISKAGYYCFGCHEHGNIFSFVMKLFNLDFMQACDKLNADFRLNIPRTHSSLSTEDRIRMAEERKHKLAEQANEEYIQKIKQQKLEDLESRRINLAINRDKIKDSIYDNNGRFMTELVGDEDFDALCGELMRIDKEFERITYKIVEIELAEKDEILKICRSVNNNMA